MLCLPELLPLTGLFAGSGFASPASTSLSDWAEDSSPAVSGRVITARLRLNHAYVPRDRPAIDVHDSIRR